MQRNDAIAIPLKEYSIGQLQNSVFTVISATGGFLNMGHLELFALYPVASVLPAFAQVRPDDIFVSFQQNDENSEISFLLSVVGEIARGQKSRTIEQLGHPEAILLL
uniref:Uncharacterized protein n=1 Tax=Spongospora subterranea TaxID=70186 RepID=A0A0H5QYF5_9EUKA|eukprot:CRZ07000.1 hypothetical protein [Spongospora subterranea]